MSGSKCVHVACFKLSGVGILVLFYILAFIEADEEARIQHDKGSSNL